MADETLTLGVAEAARIELKSYSVTIPMGSLSIGVDNIHHDVFLSPKFVQAARDYLFDLIRQSTNATYFSGIELRTVKSLDNAAFRKLLTDLLQSALTQAKYSAVASLVPPSLNAGANLADSFLFSPVFSFPNDFAGNPCASRPSASSSRPFAMRACSVTRRYSAEPRTSSIGAASASTASAAAARLRASSA